MHDTATLTTSGPHAPVNPSGDLPPAAVAALATATALLGGLVLGVGSQVLQGLLPGAWVVVANSGVAWAIGAFAIGTLMPSARAAVFGGATALVLASFSFYWAVEWFEGYASGIRGPLVWSAAGLVAGPAFGLAGRIVRTRPDLRWLALAPVAGILVGEGAILVWFVGVDDLWPAGLVELLAGAALTALCAWRDRRPLVVLGIVAAAIVVHHLAYDAINVGFLIRQ